MKLKKRSIALFLYFVVLVIPIYWMLNMSLRSNADILSSFSLYPADITFKNYIKVFTDPTWYVDTYPIFSSLEAPPAPVTVSVTVKAPAVVYV